MTQRDGELKPLFVLGSFVTACCAEVARLPRPGETLAATRFTSEPGGKGFNVALGARRLGAEVDILAAIGDDAFGGLAAAALAAAGLSGELVHRHPVATGAGVVLVQAGGETVVAVCSGANLCLSAGDARAAASRIRAAALVTAQLEIADAPILEAFSIAREAGVPTLLNPSPFRVLSAELLAATQILVVNEREAGDLAAALGLAEPRFDAAAVVRMGAALRSRGPRTLVVTLGARGAIAVADDGTPTVQPAFAVDAIDSLGAGDAFVAGLATALVGNLPLAEALRRGAAAGALTAARQGTYTALPSAADLETLLGRGLAKGSGNGDT